MFMLPHFRGKHQSPGGEKMIVVSVIVYLLIFIVIFAAAFALNKLQAKGGFIKALFFSYAGLLIISSVVYFVLPLEQAEKAAIKSDGPSLYHYFETGQTDKIDPAFIKKQWDFTYEGKELLLIDNHNNLPMTYVEKSAEENLLEITYYEKPTYIDGYNISAYTEGPNITLSADSLMIADYWNEEHAIFKPEFPFRQFSDIRLMPDEWGHGEDIIHIRISEDIQLQYEEWQNIYLMGE